MAWAEDGASCAFPRDRASRCGASQDLRRRPHTLVAAVDAVFRPRDGAIPSWQVFTRRRRQRRRVFFAAATAERPIGCSAGHHLAWKVPPTRLAGESAERLESPRFEHPPKWKTDIVRA